MYQASQNAIFQLWCWLACCFKVNCRHQGPNHLQASGIPHTTQTVEELFNLVDIDGSGIMEWSEFETFVANEIQEGRESLCCPLVQAYSLPPWWMCYAVRAAWQLS